MTGFTLIGSEFLVPPTALPGVPARYSAAAGLADGGYVIAWASWVNGENYNVFVQRYDANGTEVGAEFTVNTYTTGTQYAPSITGLNDGGFVVTWDSYGQDSGISGIYGQRYDANGVVVGSEFQINTYSASGIIRDSEVTGLSDGSFVVTWSSTSQDGVSAQRYDTNGVAIGTEFLITADASIATIGDKDPSITALSDGGFVVTWDAYTTSGDQATVLAQRYDADGNAVGGAFVVNSYAAGWQVFSSVTALSDGGFVVVWHSDVNQDGISGDGSGSQDGSSDGVYGQIYNASGVAVGGEFQINTFTAGDQSHPSITALADGGFVVVWQSDEQDGEGWGVYGQRYDASGAPVGSEILINTLTQGDSLRAEVAALENGGFLVTWSAWTVDGTGTHTNTIHAQQFAAELYGTSGDDTIIDTVGADWIDGQGGNDVLNGGVGNDTIFGGAGADELWGGAGFDTLYGGTGDDTLYGGFQHDVLWGGTGADELIGDGGDDTLWGEGGMDRLVGGEGLDQMHGGTEDDVLLGGAHDDTLWGDDGNDRLLGGWQNDTLYGGAGDDTLYGESHNDRLYGEDGNDVLDGGSGNDQLTGGAGDDTLTGGSGNDQFIFADGFGNDVITDFEELNGQERINLRDVTAITDMADLLANHMTQIGNNVLINDLLGNTITLLDVNIGDLGANDFIF